VTDSPITAVLFDWDGTLVDTKSAIQKSYRDVTTRVLGKPYPNTPEEESLILPMRAQESFGMMSDDPAVVEQLIAGYHDVYLRNSEELAGAFSGAVETLAGLKERGLTLGVVTSKGRDRMESDALRYGLVGLFDIVVTGDDSAERKPHPGPIIDALELLGISGAQAIYVGDGPQDVLAGRGAGTLTVSCSYGFHGPAECMAENPDFLIESIEELTAVVDQILAGTGSTSAG
jgi:HAD superfamily hydrolase (TIGR01509 family)